MSALSITNPAPSERRLTGGILFLLAGLAALARPRRKMMGFAFALPILRRYEVAFTAPRARS